MSKSIRSYPKEHQLDVIRRRLANKTMGLGYWAAVDAMKKINKTSTANKKTESGQLLLGYALLLLVVGIVALGIVSLLTQDTTVLHIYNSVSQLFQSIG